VCKWRMSEFRSIAVPKNQACPFLPNAKNLLIDDHLLTQCVWEIMYIPYARNRMFQKFST
jgi:hypothetical protein